ncbi:MAG: hypothetical protein ACP5O7_12465 [Phycisphaerae bacterium]
MPQTVVRQLAGRPKRLGLLPALVALLVSDKVRALLVMLSVFA